jgi:hypothetical protein
MCIVNQEVSAVIDGEFYEAEISRHPTLQSVIVIKKRVWIDMGYGPVSQMLPCRASDEIKQQLMADGDRIWKWFIEESAKTWSKKEIKPYIAKESAVRPLAFRVDTPEKERFMESLNKIAFKQDAIITPIELNSQGNLIHRQTDGFPAIRG